MTDNEKEENERKRMFLEKVINLCKNYNLWISHEDSYGAFIITKDSTESWLRGAIEHD